MVGVASLWHEIGPAAFAFPAQTASAEATRQILWGVAILLAILFVAVIAGLIVRRILFSGLDKSDSTGFTLEQMRRMHEAGELSEEEWEAMRTALLGSSRHELQTRADDRPTDAPSANGIIPDADNRPSGDNNQSSPEHEADDGESDNPENDPGNPSPPNAS